jgi:hypothetical protein
MYKDYEVQKCSFLSLKKKEAAKKLRKYYYGATSLAFLHPLWNASSRCFGIA